MRANPGSRVLLKWMIYRSGSVIAALTFGLTLRVSGMLG